MNLHLELWRIEEPIDSTLESSPSMKEPPFLDLDIDAWIQEEQDSTLDLSHWLSASLTIPQISTPPSPTLISIQPVFPLPPSTTMTTTAKPIKLHINIPKSCDSSFKTPKQWPNVIQLYLLVNTEVYNNDDKKITFVLSYTTKGSALTWATTFCKNAIDATGTVTLGTYPDFIAKFNKAFK